MIRGYSIRQQVKFLETQYDPIVSQRLMATIPEDIRVALWDIKPAQWYPRRYAVALFRAIASHRGNDERAVQDDLVRCGTFVATEASNTFLKILMRMLTPALFAKKIPEFWQRDQKGGHFEIDTSKTKDGQLHLELCDVEGYDHIAISGIGWISFGLKAIGNEKAVVKQHGWSLSNPGPDRISYEVTWT